MLASTATAVRHGFLDGTTRDLADLLGRPARAPLATAAAAAARPEAGLRLARRARVTLLHTGTLLGARNGSPPEERRVWQRESST